MANVQYNKLEDKGKDKFWEELDGKERRAANLLGWNQKTWDEGESLPMENKFWKSSSVRLCSADQKPKNLNEDERKAATVLGFTADTWDHGMDQHEAATKIQHIFRSKSKQKIWAGKSDIDKPQPADPPPQSSRPCRFKCCFGSAGPDAVAAAALEAEGDGTEGNEEETGAVAQSDSTER